MKNKAKQSSTDFMKTGSVEKALFSLGIPAMIAMIINVIYNFVDTIFIGQLNDTAAMGAATVAYPIFMIITATGQLIGIGALSYISRMLGSKKEEQANHTATTAFMLSIVIAVFITITGLLFLPNILSLMGASETVLPKAQSYCKWLLLGSIFTLLNMTLSSLIRAEGKSTASMISLIIGAVVNMLLDPLFMFTFHGGVAGAAIATVMGQLFSTLYLLYYYLTGKTVVSIQLKKHMRFNSETKLILSEIFKIGFPVFLMQFLLSIATSILNKAATPYGDSAVAAIGIAYKVYTLPVYLIAGFIQGFQPFIAYNYGASLYNRINYAIRFTHKLLIGSSIAFTVLFISFPSIFIGMFTKDGTVTALACNSLSSMSLLFPLIAYIQLSTATFQGIGHAKEAAIISISRQGLFFIPMALILPRLFASFGEQLPFITLFFPNAMPSGLCGVMLTQPISDCMACLLTFIVSYKPLRKLKQLGNDEKAEQLESMEMELLS